MFSFSEGRFTLGYSENWCRCYFCVSLVTVMVAQLTSQSVVATRQWFSRNGHNYRKKLSHMLCREFCWQNNKTEAAECCLPYNDYNSVKWLHNLWHRIIFLKNVSIVSGQGSPFSAVAGANLNIWMAMDSIKRLEI